MAPDTTKIKPARKRRRRQASYSPSASSSSDSNEDAVAGSSGKAFTTTHTQKSTTSEATTSSDDDSDQDESMESESDSKSAASTSTGSTMTAPAQSTDPEPHPIASKPSHRPNRMSNSPSPSPRQLPAFFAPRTTEEEDERRIRFRRLYMDKLVEGFSGDLETLRASDPSLSGQRLQRLIDSLASGIDVFHDPRQDTSPTLQQPLLVQPDEVGLVLGNT